MSAVTTSAPARRRQRPVRPHDGQLVGVSCGAAAGSECRRASRPSAPFRRARPGQPERDQVNGSDGSGAHDGGTQVQACVADACNCGENPRRTDALELRRCVRVAPPFIIEAHPFNALTHAHVRVAYARTRQRTAVTGHPPAAPYSNGVVAIVHTCATRGALPSYPHPRRLPAGRIDLAPPHCCC